MSVACGCLPERTFDPVGAGHFGASRGTKPNGEPRLHNGQDYNGYPGTIIRACVGGVVTRVAGRPYAKGDLRYVEIKDDQDRYWRYFYVQRVEDLRLRQRVYSGDCIGVLQNCAARMSSDGEKTLGEQGMPNHLHLEVRTDPENYMDPAKLLL